MYFHFPTFFKLMKLTFSPKRFHFRHALTVLAFLLPFLLLRALVWILWKLDNFLFPDYRKQPVQAPIYIIGNPRSGTTFLHRMISRDPQFSYLKLYDTIFPPVSARKLIHGAVHVDMYLGSPLAKLVNWFGKKGFSGWENIHKTGADQAESDEMFFMYAMLSPLLGLLFPNFKDLESATFADALPEKDRRKLMDYYHQCLQRHLYASGPDKVLLQKVALIAGRLESILGTYPDMRIVHMVRHPYESMPSLISMFQVPWRKLAPRALKDDRASRELAGMIFRYYAAIQEIKAHLPEDRFVEIRYEDLVADPKGTVERIYRKFNIPMTDAYKINLEEETRKARQYKSKHKYRLKDAGLTEDEIYENLKDLFQEYGFER